jgi:hypothetical protein
MLSVQVILVKTDCHTGTQEKTVKSVSLSEEHPVSICAQNELDRLINESKADLIHVITPGVVVLPDFYRAMVTMIEHKGVDFATCMCSVLNSESPKQVKAGEDGFDSAQVLVRRWVYREMGVGDINPLELVRRVLGEYRGAEVPHNLTVRL